MNLVLKRVQTSNFIAFLLTFELIRIHVLTKIREAHKKLSGRLEPPRYKKD